MFALPFDADMGLARIAFFFGSGISYASKAPNVGMISHALFGQNWTRHTSGIFVPSLPMDDPECARIGQNAQGLLRYIKGELDAHLLEREGRDSHYEDLYAAALQIYQDESREITNPLIARSIQAIRLAAASLYVNGPTNAFSDSFTTLVGRALDLIQCVVQRELGAAATPQKLGILSEISQTVPEVDIFTLNHDQLVERQLASTGIGISDGFGDIRKGYRIFNNHWPEGPGVRVLKLHGSLNWYFCRFKRFDQYAAFDQPLEKCFDEDGTRVDDLNPLPVFLSGTTVKEQRYPYDMFGEVFLRFRQLTTANRRLICCGYGWGDKGINIRLDQWLHDQPDNRLIILHGGDLDELRQKRYWWRRWEPYTNAGKVVVVPRWLSDCSLPQIQSLCA